ISLATIRACGEGVNFSITSASSTLFPRTMSISSRILRGDVPVFFTTDLTSIYLLTGSFSSRGGFLGSFFFLNRMSSEGAGRSEFTQSMTDHVFRDINRYMPSTIMDRNSQPDKIRDDRTPARPGLKNSFFAAVADCQCSF